MSVDVVIIGMGYVGLPLAQEAARAGLEVLGYDISTGVVEEAGKPRTRSKALKALAEKVTRHGKVENLAIMHGGADDELDTMLGLLATAAPRDEIHIDEIGATIGTHAGPRVMGVTFQVAKGG